jgi:hypothetical protein
MNRQVKLTRRTTPLMRTLKTVMMLLPLIAVWMIALTQLVFAVFAEKVFFAARSIPFHAVTHREEPALFVFLVVISFVIVSFFGWAILGLIPKRDEQV